MNCNQARNALDAVFDEGAPLDAALAAHVVACAACRAHQAALEALDLRIRESPTLMHDEALVARIQATIAAQPAARVPRWTQVAALAATLLLLAGLGWFIVPVDVSPVLRLQAWMPQEPLLPEWSYVRQEFMEIPAAMTGDVEGIMYGASRFWESTIRWSSNLLGSSSPVLWIAFFTCLASAAALNSLEWKSRHR